MNKTFIIAEIGINHNGDMDITKRLIDGAAESGCDAVKFQKRTIDVVYGELPTENKNRAQSLVKKNTMKLIAIAKKRESSGLHQLGTQKANYL